MTSVSDFERRRRGGNGGGARLSREPRGPPNEGNNGLLIAKDDEALALASAAPEDAARVVVVATKDSGSDETMLCANSGWLEAGVEVEEGETGSPDDNGGRFGKLEVCARFRGTVDRERKKSHECYGNLACRELISSRVS